MNRGINNGEDLPTDILVVGTIVFENLLLI